MPNEKKLTLNITEDMHARLEEISGDLGITTTELLRRAIGLVSVAHTAVQESTDKYAYLCTRSEADEFEPRHTLSPLMY